MLILITLATLVSFGVTEREHKVHNIILYPGKYSWCNTTRIQQVVASPGYEPVTIANNVCVGACYSYSIPSTQPAEPGELIGPYCDSCQPITTKCYHVTLQADSNNIKGPTTFQKRVQIIMDCSCMSCEKTPKDDCEISDQVTVELPDDLFSTTSEENESEEKPELLDFPNKKRPDFDLTKLKNGKYDINSILITLLKSIQTEGENTNINYDKNELAKLLKIIEGSKHELSDENLMDFINFVSIHNSEDMELDLSRLKNVLSNYQKKQQLVKSFGLEQGQNNNNQIEQDLKKLKLPENFGLENNLHHKHHLGDQVHVGMDLGHLVKGPHGSMVLSPDLKVEEKLNIDSDILKPNHDGVVIAYENHNNRKTN